MSGNVTQAQCANSASAGAGCTIVDPAANSYGADFAAAGGGVYITELGDDGVKIWFYTVGLTLPLLHGAKLIRQRSAIPSQVSADATSIDTSALGTPVAYYPNTACNVDKYLGRESRMLTTGEETNIQLKRSRSTLLFVVTGPDSLRSLKPLAQLSPATSLGMLSFIWTLLSS